MAQERVERRLAAIVVADIVGYSRMMHDNPEATLAAINRQRTKLIDPKLVEHRGRLVKTMGDGLLIEFSSIIDAVNWAVETQVELAQTNIDPDADPAQRINLRIGINLGEIIVENGDIFGDGVNVAARLEPLAETGGICISHDVYRQCRSRGDLSFEDMGEQLLKNIAEPRRLWRIRPPAEAQEDGPAQRKTRYDDRPLSQTGFPAWVERVMTRLIDVPPPFAALAMFVLGLAFVGASLVIGNGEFSYVLRVGDETVVKQVGFLYAVNWSITFLILFPVLFAVALYGYKDASGILKNLTKHHMLVDERGEPVDQKDLARRWARSWRAVCLASAILFALTIGYAVWEFQTVAGQHLLGGASYPETIRLSDAYQERDWSVAALLPTVGENAVPRVANFVFGLVCYLVMVGIGAGFIFSFYAYLLAMVAMIYEFAHHSKGIRLIPDLAVDPVGDKFEFRAGFQIFERLFQNALLVTLLSFLIFFLIHVQNLYLRDPSSSIVAFLLPDFARAIASADGTLGVAGALLHEFSTRGSVTNFSSALTYGLGALLFMVLLLGLSTTLRMAAQRSQIDFREYLMDTKNPVPPWLRSTGREGAIRNLDAMKFWPLRFPRLNHTLIFLLSAGVCMIYYKLGSSVLLIGFVYAAYRTIRTAGR